DVDHAFFVRDGGFGLAAELDGPGHGVTGRVDGRRILAAGVERENAVRGRLVDDGVRPVAHLDPRRLFECLQVEHGHGRTAAVADEALFVLWRDGDAVNAGLFLNLAGELARLHVHDHHAVGAGNV